MTPPRRVRSRRRRLAAGITIGVAIAAVAWLGAGWSTAFYVTLPANRPVPPCRELAGAAVEAVELATDDGVRLRAWLARRDPERCVMLFAGIGGDRQSCRSRAELYLGAGWSVLLPDLRGTGESDVTRNTLGYRERLDVHAWAAWLNARGFARIAAHGLSLGAAAVAYTLPDRPDYAFVVLESCYDDIASTLPNRLPWVPFPDVAFLPVGWFTKLYVGAAMAELRPVQAVASARAPTLILAGDADRKVRPAETRRLFDACGAERKRLGWIHGAGHVDLLDSAPAEYAALVSALLDDL